MILWWLNFYPPSWNSSWLNSRTMQRVHLYSKKKNMLRWIWCPVKEHKKFISIRASFHSLKKWTSTQESWNKWGFKKSKLSRSSFSEMMVLEWSKISNHEQTELGWPSFVIYLVFYDPSDSFVFILSST